MTSSAAKGGFVWSLVIFVTSSAGCTGSSIYLKRVKQIELITFHRMYPAYRETTAVVPEKSYVVGDEDYSIKVVDFLPDFQIDAGGRIFSGSADLVNPAAKVLVFKGRKKVATEWAFQGDGPPHFRRSSFLGFRIADLRLDTSSAVTGTEER